MRDTLTFIEFTNALTHTHKEADTLLDIFPRCVVWKSLNRLYCYFFNPHSQNLTKKWVKPFAAYQPVYLFN